MPSPWVLFPGYSEGTTSAPAHPLCHDSLLYFSPKATEPETVALNQESKEIFPLSGVLSWQQKVDQHRDRTDNWTKTQRWIWKSFSSAGALKMKQGH